MVSDVLCEGHSACRRRTGRRHVKDDMPKTLVKFTLVGGWPTLVRRVGHV